MTDLLQSLSKDLKPLNDVILLREQLKTTNVALEVLNRRLTGFLVFIVFAGCFNSQFKFIFFEGCFTFLIHNQVFKYYLLIYSS